MGILDRLAPRRPEPELLPEVVVPVEDPSFASKALPKFLKTLGPPRPAPSILDVAPVYGPNISFFGQHLGCKLFVEDVYADVERHLKAGRSTQLAAFFETRFTQPDQSVDAVICWDIIDYLDRPAAEALARQLVRVLKRDGILLGLFGTAASQDAHYTRYIVVDETTLKYRPHPASRGRQAVLLNRDVIRLFPGLTVSDSFLLKNNVREILFRKTA